jgi:hypothetical protein
MSLRPFRPMTDAELLELGRSYHLLNHRRDALFQLRDAVTTLNGANPALYAEAMQAAQAALDRLKAIAEQEPQQ